MGEGGTTTCGSNNFKVEKWSIEIFFFKGKILALRVADIFKIQELILTIKLKTIIVILKS